MDLKQQLEENRKKVMDMPFSVRAEMSRRHLDVLQQLTESAEEHLQEHYREWENGALAKEFLRHALPIEPMAECTKTLYGYGERMAATFGEHPRLRVQLLQLLQRLLQQLEPEWEEAPAKAPAIQQELRLTERNIALADSGQLDKIANDDFIRTDPVEWTAAWEEAIDEVYRQMEQTMRETDQPTADCRNYWKLKAQLLKAAGIDWKSPAEMNPDISFF